MLKNVEVRCEWGEDGLSSLKPWADVIIIVDVMSFCTCVDIVVSRDSIVYPYRFKDKSTYIFAEQKKAYAAVARSQPGFTLSPVSLTQFPSNSALVLPSPNGATLSLLAYGAIVFAGCLRNASSVAKAAVASGNKIAVIPAGERWPSNGLRVSYEDLVGAGAIISAISGINSVEASIACLVFRHSSEIYFKDLEQCVSAMELIERGYPGDVAIATQYDVSNTIPILRDGYYIDGRNLSATPS